MADDVCSFASFCCVHSVMLRVKFTQFAARAFHSSAAARAVRCLSFCCSIYASFYEISVVGTAINVSLRTFSSSDFC
jgi:hypothetical protein